MSGSWALLVATFLLSLLIAGVLAYQRVRLSLILAICGLICVIGIVLPGLTFEVDAHWSDQLLAEVAISIVVLAFSAATALVARAARGEP